MVRVRLDHIGKKYNRQWIFRNLSFDFQSGSSTALTGNNGSGKSTLLQLIYQYQALSEGKVIYDVDAKSIEAEDLVGKVAFAAPYLELPGEFTLLEMLHFHFRFFTLQQEFSIARLIQECGLTGQEHKPIKYFSSGMQQRLKLAMALFANTPLLLLDEPCSNLDEQGISWYRNQIQKNPSNRTCIIASNQAFEYEFCDQILVITDFKPAIS